jgi:hypothetical protein
MPSIEIACIDLDAPALPPPTSFAVVFERGLRSHRSPAPRFQSDFDALAGCLYHIGDPAFSGRDQSAFNAYALLSEASRDAEPPSFLEFDATHLPSVQALVSWLVDQSPGGRILFTSDWQFGPDGCFRSAPLGLEDLWRLHDSRGLLLNAAYPVATNV